MGARESQLLLHRYHGHGDGAGRRRGGDELAATLHCRVRRGPNDFAVFPPSLPRAALTPTLTLDSPSPSSSSASTQNFQDSIESSKEEEMGQVSRTPIVESARRLVELGIELFRCKITDLRGGCGCGCSCNRTAVWSFAAVVGFVGGLILEKDERINQLMDQIIKMSEVIAANYKVPVLMKA
ncbi:uncharacterized protein A4U43_C03F27280 [Asparagus officinalis]|uniref:Uncharacterized protein n=1 Tax=Asparagus officinalis TaxID=4686 RepID=A0A5P1FII9_ASPOF|nr:uncharacterized protein A4U43_C03F27280 [Asparagus officinalis]